MRFILDPFSPSGVSVAPVEPRVIQSNGYVSNKATGLITAGTNVTITGDGTDSVPYRISASGGGANDNDDSAPVGQSDGYLGVTNGVLYFFSNGHRYKLSGVLDDPPVNVNSVFPVWFTLIPQ